MQKAKILGRVGGILSSSRNEASLHLALVSLYGGTFKVKFTEALDDIAKRKKKPAKQVWELRLQSTKKLENSIQIVAFRVDSPRERLVILTLIDGELYIHP